MHRDLYEETNMDPQSAVMAHKVLGCDMSYPIHYDVFSLGCEAYEDAVKELNGALTKASIPQDKFPQIIEGKSVNFNI